MATLDKNFRAFLSEIEPNTERLKSAQEMPAKVREHLKKHAELKTVESHTRLTGSYGRQTSNGRIKDVDILVFVADEYKDDIPTLFKLLRETLKELPEELDDCGPVETRAQRRSVNVELANHDLSLDIVPVRLKTENATDVLLVPDREWEKWVDTQPLGYAQKLSDLNAENGGKVVSLIKMFKHWRDCSFIRRRPKSYWLESLVVQHIDCEWVTTSGKGYGVIVADLLDSMYEKLKPTLDKADEVPPIPDAMLRNNVAWNWERSHFETFMERVSESRGWARRAVNSDDDDKAIELWQKVFGSEFPSTILAESICKGLDFGSASSQGANLVTGTGLVSTTPLAGILTTPAPVKRFYGD